MKASKEKSAPANQPGAQPPQKEQHSKDDERKDREAGFDRTLEESFPASDPPSSIRNPRAPDADRG